jgi:hypothetical protein
MAGTVTVTRTEIKTKYKGDLIEKITIDWTADAADGSVPNTSIDSLYGYVVKALTNPGATAPTSNYDIKLLDPDDSAIDALAGALDNRHTSNSEQVYPTASGAQIPVYLCGSYTFNLANNSVNSATGTVILFIKEKL